MTPAKPLKTCSRSRLAKLEKKWHRKPLENYSKSRKLESQAIEDYARNRPAGTDPAGSSPRGEPCGGSAARSASPRGAKETHVIPHFLASSIWAMRAAF